MKYILVLSAIFLVLVSNKARSDDVVLQDWETSTQPVLINSERPRLPGAIWIQDLEGWVDVEFTVALDGTAHSPRILESSIDGVFDRATLEAVASWRFEPATINGRPVEASHEIRQSFYFEDEHDAISEAFSRRARGISRAFAKGDLDTAWKKIGQLEEKRLKMLAEGVYMDFFKATYYERTGDATLALHHLNRALPIADDHVGKAVRDQMLRSAVKLNAEQRNFAAALKRYEELEALMGKLPAEDPAHQQVAAIRSTIAGDQPLQWEAILEHCEDCEPETYTWSHPLVRNRFTLSTVPDSLEDTQVRCGDRFQYFRLRAGETYLIPDAGAGCYFRTNSWKTESFSFIELPESL